MMHIRKTVLLLVLMGATQALTACDETGTGGALYYDSIMWNDYYYAPAAGRPPVAGGPATRPPVARPPVARPPAARPPIHRPR